MLLSFIIVERFYKNILRLIVYSMKIEGNIYFERPVKATSDRAK